LLGKEVVAVHAGKKAPGKLPSWVTEKNIRVVPWSGLAITPKPPK
jgi:hypothetical protein